MEIKSKKVLVEEGQRLLVRIDGEIDLGGITYGTWHHEIWNDREKYEAGIHTEEMSDGTRIYCSSHAGFKDEAAILTFKKGNRFQDEND